MTSLSVHCVRICLVHHHTHKLNTRLLSTPLPSIFIILFSALCSRCNVLDTIGDKTPAEKRYEYFKLLDADNSDGIDFEEFLHVIAMHFSQKEAEEADRISRGSPEKPAMGGGFEKLYAESTRRKTGCNRLSITQQVNAALI